MQKKNQTLAIILNNSISVELYQQTENYFQASLWQMFFLNMLLLSFSDVIPARFHFSVKMRKWEQKKKSKTDKELFIRNYFAKTFEMMFPSWYLSMKILPSPYTIPAYNMYLSFFVPICCWWFCWSWIQKKRLSQRWENARTM